MTTASMPIRRLFIYLLALFAVWGMLDALNAWTTSRRAVGQDPTQEPAAGPSGDQQRGLSGAGIPAEAARDERDKGEIAARTEPAPTSPKPPVTLWELYQKGGILMYPITFLSGVVVCFGLERFLGLRRGAVMPRRLVRGLRNLAAQSGGLDPRSAYELCGRYSVAGANVVKTMLAKADRPDIEVEQAVTAANEREASRLYFHVRWLNMAMSVAPMLGLLGTVQGMIIVFMGVSNLPTGANKAAYMAEGIYLKLICTFAGLVVAIPAAMLSYLFEARIQLLLGEVEDLVLELLPRMRRFDKQRRRGDSSRKSETE